MMDNQVDVSNLKHLLPIYYRRLFPTYSYCKWLSGGEQPAASKTFSHREFSFTLENDVYIRYLSYGDHAEFEKDLLNKCPHKIDVGAVFNVKPKDHNSIRQEAFRAMEKELVIDIDISDYDDVRKCCSGADVCRRCWPLITVAVKVIDKALRDDFGFRHLLWVFSGRRGVHCWVCDSSVRGLSNQERSAVVEYLTVVRASSDGISQRVQLKYPVHPVVERSIRMIEEMFERYACVDQDILGTDENIVRFLKQMVPNEAIPAIEEAWKDFDKIPDNQKSIERWRAFVSACIRSVVSRKHKNLPSEIMLQMCYPRMDVNVSKSMNHLLKGPFCIHPKTGIVSVPLKMDELDIDFPPEDAPKISTLVGDLDRSLSEDSANASCVKSYKQTRLGEYVAIFDRFVRLLAEDELSYKRTLNDISDVTAMGVF